MKILIKGISKTESFFHTFKTEFVYFEDFTTKRSYRLKTFDYIEVFFNRERIHSALGYLSPEDFEQLKVA